MSKNKNRSGAILCILFVAIIIVLVLVAVPTISSKRAKNTGALNLFVAITKDKPEITVENVVDEASVSDVCNVNVKCNAYYETVKIKLNLYDVNNEIIKTIYFDEVNFEDGKTYTLVYELTGSEMALTRRFGASLLSYS